MDGSSLSNPRCIGCGGLIIDSLGRWLRGFYCFIWVASNLYVEPMAILCGLKLARKLGCNSVICERVSLKAIKIINKGDEYFH